MEIIEVCLNLGIRKPPWIASLMLYLGAAPSSYLEQITVWLLAFIRVQILTVIRTMLAKRSLNHVAYSSEFEQIFRRFVLIYKFILYTYC